MKNISKSPGNFVENIIQKRKSPASANTIVFTDAPAVVSGSAFLKEKEESRFDVLNAMKNSLKTANTLLIEALGDKYVWICCHQQTRAKI